MQYRVQPLSSTGKHLQGYAFQSSIREIFKVSHTLHTQFNSAVASLFGLSSQQSGVVEFIMLHRQQSNCFVNNQHNIFLKLYLLQFLICGITDIRSDSLGEDMNLIRWQSLNITVYIRCVLNKESIINSKPFHFRTQMQQIAPFSVPQSVRQGDTDLL